MDNDTKRNDASAQPKEMEKPRDLREANENIRKSQGDDATGAIDANKTGNKPALDRGR